MTSIAEIVQQLRNERQRIDRAIQTLTSISGNSAGRGRRLGAFTNKRKRRHMSAAARAKIAAAQRARWARQKAAAKKR